MKRKEKIQKLLQKKPKFTVVECPQKADVKPALQVSLCDGKGEAFGNTPKTESNRKSLPHKPSGRTSRFPKDKNKRIYCEGKALEDRIERVKAAMSRKGESAEYIQNVVNKIRRTAELPAKRKQQGLLLQGKALEDKIERVKSAMSIKGESAENIENVVNKIRRTAEMPAKRKGQGLLLQGKALEDKIEKVQAALIRKGKDPDHIRSVVNKIRKTAELQAGKMQRRCYCCKSTDHTMKDCKQNPRLTAGVGDMCFCCGSGEHFYKDCPSKSDNMNYIVCFICKEMGHLAKDCPKNERRDLSQGSECKKCGAKDHLAEGCKSPDEKEDSVVGWFIDIGD